MSTSLEQPSPEEERDPRDLARLRRLRLLALVGLLAIAVVVAAIALSQSGAEGPGEGADLAEDAREVERMFAGIPQRGLTLGDPNAPATLIEFADLQCPFCGDFARDTLPTVVERYVRSGRLRMEYQPLVVLGGDSREAASVAIAAGDQNRLWQFTDMVFRNQGVENTGWVTEDYLRRIAEATPGLDAERALAGARRPEIVQTGRKADALAREVGVESTPSFVLARRGGRPERVEVTGLDPESFTRALDGALAKR